jgi:predicted O-methyltransferase YrrM
MSSETTAPPRPEGCAYDFINSRLGEFPQYQAFRAGELARAEYCRWLNSGVAELGGTGLNEDQLNLSSRFPVDERAFVADALDQLAAQGLLSGTDYPEAEFDQLWRTVGAKLRHGGFMTYIFPEEARLLFAIAHIAQPRTMVFPGSYYGYWAVWALPGISKVGGRATLIDIDRKAGAVALANLTELGMADNVSYVDSDAFAYGATLSEVDMVIIDAEGPKDVGPEHLRDKAIYAPIMAATTPALRPGGLLVAHNMLLENLTDNAYFSGRIANNERQYAKFHEHLDQHYDRQLVLPSSEGVGLYRRAGS